MEINRTLTVEEEEDYDIYLELTDIFIEILDTNWFEGELDTILIGKLEDIALANSRMVAGYAKNILVTFYGYDFDNTINPRTFKDPNNFDRKINRNFINSIVVPNPAIDKCTIKFPTNDYKIKIYSYDGKIFTQNSCTNCSDFTINNDILFSAGFYTYILESKDGLGVGKILIQ